MIEIIPSLSVIGGKCVRLQQGNYDKPVVFEENVIDIAKRFEDHGIRKLHFIDLDGAKKGNIVNYETLGLISGHTNLEIDFGGGINTDGEIANAFEYGAKKVTIGSLAINKKELFTSWVFSYGKEKITLSADSKDGKIQFRGWQKNSEIDIFEHIEYFYDRGIQYVKCSDVNKDGLLEGPAFELYDQIIKRFPGISLLASGGISSLDDVKRLEDIGVYGAIIGKAYYQNRISLKDIEMHQTTTNA